MDVPKFEQSSKSKYVMTSLAACCDAFDSTSRMAISPKEKSRVVACSDNLFDIGAMTVQLQWTRFRRQALRSLAALE
jgi:hypothetical protein